MNDLSGEYWPVHPKPQKEELFSSWLARIALGNSSTAHRFCQSIWPGFQIWNRDIDVFGWNDLISVLSKKTNTPSQEISGLTLAHYEGIVFEQLHTHCPTNWVLPVGIYHRIRRLYGLQWCPKCLSEDKVPYFRRHWRMAFVSSCHKHGIVLADRCHRCSAPAVPFQKGITVCFRCEADLRDHPATPARYEAMCAEHELAKRAIDGRTLLPGYQPIFSIAFFDIWHRLLTLVATGKRSKALRKAIADKFGGCPDGFSFSAKHEIEYLPPIERNRLMDLTCRLWPGWPFRLIAVAHASKNWASFILKDMNPVRYHLWEPVRRFVPGTPLHNP